MKLNDVIDINNKLYQVIYVGSNGSFEAEPIGEVVAKGFTRPQDVATDMQSMIEELSAFCDNKDSCDGCCLQHYSDCFWDDYTYGSLVEAYNIMNSKGVK